MTKEGKLIVALFAMVDLGKVDRTKLGEKMKTSLLDLPQGTPEKELHHHQTIAIHSNKESNPIMTKYSCKKSCHDAHVVVQCTYTYSKRKRPEMQRNIWKIFNYTKNLSFKGKNP